MKKSFIGFVIFSVLIGLVMVATSFAPDVIVTETTILTPCSDSIIKNNIVTPENWLKWQWGNYEDPTRTIKSDGPKSGLNSVMITESDVDGKSIVKITSVTENEIGYEMVTDGGQFQSLGRFIISKENDQTTIVWKDSLDIASNFKARLFAQFSNFSETIEMMNKEALESLSKSCE